MVGKGSGRADGWGVARRAQGRPEEEKEGKEKGLGMIGGAAFGGATRCDHQTRRTSFVRSGTVISTEQLSLQ